MAAAGKSGEATSSAFGLAEDDDPRIRRVYQRLRTLTIIAALTMGVGFLAVMSVIVYRVVKAGPSKSAVAAPKTLALPAGAKVLSTTADGGRVVVTVEEAGRTVVHVFDAGTLAETGRLEIGAAAPDGAPIR